MGHSSLKVIDSDSGTGIILCSDTIVYVESDYGGLLLRGGKRTGGKGKGEKSYAPFLKFLDPPLV